MKVNSYLMFQNIIPMIGNFNGLCKYFWESHIKMHPIDIDKLNKCLRITI